MHGHRELIHRPPFLQPVSTLSAEELQIPRQRRGITAHIHDPLRFHLNHRPKKRFFTAFPWWIYHDHIRMGMFSRMFFRIIFIIFWQDFLSFSDIKTCILNSVDLCIPARILDRLRYNFYTLYFPRLLCKKEGDRPDNCAYSNASP